MRGGRGVAAGGDSELGRGLWPERCAGGLCQGEHEVSSDGDNFLSFCLLQILIIFSLL